MKAEYDVKVPRNPYGKTVFSKTFWEFYDSGHQNVRLEYDTTDEAIRAQRAMCMLINRNKIYDAFTTRRKNVLYVIRSKEDDN